MNETIFFTFLSYVNRIIKVFENYPYIHNYDEDHCTMIPKIMTHIT